MTHRLPSARQRALHLLVAFTLCGGAAAAGPPFDFVHHGHFQRIVHRGDTAGRVALAALPSEAGRWGVGATAGLRGEVVQLDGRLLVSPGSDPEGRVRAPLADEQAVLFAGARVAAWHEVPLPREMDAAAFEAFVATQALAAGLPAGRPFVFRVEGRFTQLVWHVVTGEPPAAGAGHGGHHANTASGMRVFRQPGAAGQLVGVYSGAELEGVVSHPGERLHLHFVGPAAAVSGHVDGFGIAAGAVLRLPAK